MERKTFSTFDIAKLCDVYPTTVANWIDEGKLNAFSTPGGHRRVNGRDLLEFLKKHKMPVPDELLPQKSSSRKKILIVDDDPRILKSIATILKKKRGKDKVYTAADGFEAGQAIIKFEPDLVILDIMLPGLNGFKVCESIRQKNKQIKIIAITGYDTEENKNKILSAGADAYFSKPLEIQKLLRCMHGLLSKLEVSKK